MSVLDGPNEGDWSVFAERMMEQRDAAREALAAFQHEHRRKIQEFDCSYGDTPGCIHCPLDNPCLTHKLERLETQHKEALISLADMGGQVVCIECLEADCICL
jgi:hypothetical protein